MKKAILILTFLIIGLGGIQTIHAQCPMCRTAVESSMKDKNSDIGKGLNHGIIYLLSAPYLAVGIVGIGWYINSRKKRLKQNAS